MRMGTSIERGLRAGADALRLGRPDDTLLARLALPPDSVGLWLDRYGVLAASRGAREAFGEAARRGAVVAELAAALGGAMSSPVGLALARLTAEGEAFRLRARAPNGRFWEVSGGPRGALCLLVLRDAAAEEAAEAAAARELAAARAEAESLRLTLSATPIRAWRLDADGRETWRSPGAGIAPQPQDGARIAIADGGALVVDPRAPEDASVSAQSLRRFIETVSDAFANLRVGLAIYGADRRLTLSNPALAELFHADPRWLATRPTLRETLDRLREARQLPEQADYPAWRAALFTLFDGPSRAPYQDRWEMPDGRAIQVIGRPHPHGGIAFTFEDVTAAMALQREAAIMRETQRTALELVSDGVALFGLDGRTRLSNSAFHRMWRLPRRGEAPMHVSEVAAACAPLAGAASVWERIRAGVAGGEGRAPWSQRLDLTDGRNLEVRVAPMRDGSTLTAFTETPGGATAPEGLAEEAAVWTGALRAARGTVV